MNEAGRRCQRCNFAWYATQPGANPGKPRWFDESGSFWTDGQARMARRTANYDRHLTAKDKWAECPNCGSRKVKTDKSRNFRPTGAIAPTAASKVATQLDESAASPRSDLGLSASFGRSIWQRLAAFHDKHWRIIWFAIFAVAPFGSIGDDKTYTGSTAINVLKFVGILIACWAAASGFLYLHLRHKGKL
jgi:hypothetical protein